MKLKIQKSDFLRGLKLASDVADRKGSLPILAFALLRAKKGSPGNLLVGATDLSISTMADAQATVEQAGDIALPARQFYEVIRGLPGDEVSMSVDENRRAKVKAMKSEFVIAGVDAKDFPKMPDMSSEPAARIDAPVFREMLSWTVFSVAHDEARPHLAGVLLETGGGKGVCVSTDGHRLSKVGRTIQAPNWDVLIPRKGAHQIIQLLDGREAPVGVDITNGLIAVRADNIGVWAKLVDGQFPPYEQVIPHDDGTGLIVTRTALLEALTRVSIVSDKDNGVTLTMGKNALRIDTHNTDVGNAQEDIDVEGNIKDIRIGVNAAYMREWLSTATCEKVRISADDELSPVVMRPTDDTDYVAVVMPMRIT